MALLKSGTRIYGNATIDTKLAIDGRDSATSNSTGALTVAGGVGVAGNIFSTGNLVVTNANLGNAASANYFIGDGSLLTNIAGSYSNANVANYLPTYTGNFTAGNANITGNLVVTHVNANSANITGNLVVSEYINGTLSTSAQPNITSTGTLTALTVSGDTTITGNLTVSGTTVTVSSNNISYSDSLIEMHTQANLAPLTSDDGKDIGIHVHYFKTSDKHAFFGFSNDTLAFEYYVDGTETNGVFSGTYGNIKGQTLISNVANGTAPLHVNSVTQVANLNAEFSGTVTVNAQPNITSVGTLSNLSISNGISANGSYGNLFDVLTSDGNGNTEWKARYYYTTTMYDFTAYGMGYMTIAPNQDPDTFGYIPGVSIPHGSIWMLVTNDGLTDPAPITITSPNSKSTPMMWVTIDGSGPYDPVINPNGGDYWFNITPPA
jgi:hypothetical protein